MHVILDFDGTITKNDTIGPLASFGLALQQQKGRDLASAWDGILQKYIADHEQHKTTYEPRVSARTTLQHEIAFLHSLRDLDMKSISRVQDSGLFKGTSSSHLFAAGKEAVKTGTVQLRAGFRPFIDELLRKGHRVSVVSVNWSSWFIRGVIAPFELEVLANDIDESGEILGPVLPGSSGERQDVLTSSADKLRVVNSLCVAEAGGETQILYFGDSATDLECLLVWRGVVVCDNGQGKLLELLRRVEVFVPNVSAVDSTEDQLCWARDFLEVSTHSDALGL